MLKVILGILFLLAAGCSPQQLEHKLLTTQESALVRAAVQDIVRSDRRSFAARLAPELARTELPLAAMRGQLPAPPVELTLLQANVVKMNGQRTAHAVYVVQGANGWAVSEITMTTRDGRPQLSGIYVQRTNSDPREANRFDIASGGIAGWAMIAAMLAAVATTVAGLWRIWKSGQFERRWLWTLGALVGLTTLRMNWTTGEFVFQPVSFQLLSVSAIRPSLGAWTLGVSLPIVALIALFRRRREREGAGAQA